MRVRIWRRKGETGPSRPIDLVVIAEKDIPSFSFDIIFRVNVTPGKLVGTFQEYNINIVKTGNISIPTNLAQIIQSLKRLVVSAQEVYYDVPNHLVMIPVMAGIGIFSIGVAVGKKMKRR